MKPLYALCLFCTIAVLIACTGCTGTAPATPTPTTVMTTTATPVVEPTIYPGALVLNQIVPFGIAGKNGTATVYKAELRSAFSWSSPSYNSPRDQQRAGESLYTTQYGYITEKPQEGNTFLFIFVRLENTGSERMVAPSPNQFLVEYNGKTYPYTSVQGSDVTVSSVRVGQYDYQIGTGGVSGFIMPGQSNAADGFLIYEVPATIDLSKAALIVTLDAEHRAAWKLA
ncbi:MAG TPA: DUF4352 domain-containing protein [Methanoregula sp.]|nr:DUF4352 domain-containing protein [Methanoregula sp.]